MPDATRSLHMGAKSSSLSDAMEFVRRGALEARLPEARIGELEILLEEIFLNVCRHAYPNEVEGSVNLSYSLPEPGVLSVEVADQGAEFNPLTAEPPDLTLDLEGRPIGGLGIVLVGALAKSVDYRRESGWNRLTFVVATDS